MPIARQKITNNLVTLRRLTKPGIHSLANTVTIACLRLLIDTLTEVDLALQDLDERNAKP